MQRKEKKRAHLVTRAVLHELERFPFVSVKIKENTDVHMVRFSSVVTSGSLEVFDKETHAELWAYTCHHTDSCTTPPHTLPITPPPPPAWRKLYHASSATQSSFLRRQQPGRYSRTGSQSWILAMWCIGFLHVVKSAVWDIDKERWAQLTWQQWRINYVIILLA